MKELQVSLSGKVQGVGFRVFAKQLADELDVVGWVENTEDGRVEILAQGEPEVLEAYLAKLKTGPYWAEIKSYTAEIDEAGDKQVQFEIL